MWLGEPLRHRRCWDCPERHRRRPGPWSRHRHPPRGQSQSLSRVFFIINGKGDTFCGVLTTPRKRRGSGELLSHSHVTTQRQDKNSMPPWRFPNQFSCAWGIVSCLLPCLPSSECQRCAKHKNLEKDHAAESQGPACPARAQRRKDAPSSQACLLRCVSHASRAGTAHWPQYWTHWSE